MANTVQKKLLSLKDLLIRIKDNKLRPFANQMFTLMGVSWCAYIHSGKVGSRDDRARTDDLCNVTAAL